MGEILIISGAEEYGDPWHPFSATSAEIARALADLGRIGIREDVDAALSSLGDTRHPPVDLAVLNIGNAGPGTPSPSARAGVSSFVERGGAVLSVHSSSTAFPDWDEWESISGGRWVRGTSFHPPRGLAVIELTPVLARDGRARSFETIDERYTDLRVHPDAAVVATHQEGGSTHPLAWVAPRGRVIYLGLGHDAEAYRSEGSRELLVAAAEHLLAASPPDNPSSIAP